MTDKTKKKKKKKVSLKDDFFEKVKIDENKNKRVSMKKEAIKYIIDEKDDYLVKLLKKTINKKNISLQAIYNKLGDPTTGYNLVYSLNQRHKIYFETFETWMKLLGLDYKMKILKRKEKE